MVDVQNGFSGSLSPGQLDMLCMTRQSVGLYLSICIILIFRNFSDTTIPLLLNLMLSPGLIRYSPLYQSRYLWLYCVIILVKNVPVIGLTIVPNEIHTFVVSTNLPFLTKNILP